VATCAAAKLGQPLPPRLPPALPHWTLMNSSLNLA